MVRGTAALKDLDEGVDALLLQVAMQLPLPTPIAIGMRRERNNGVLRVKRWSRRQRGPVDAGEIDFGLVNHYYLWRALKENPDAPAAETF